MLNTQLDQSVPYGCVQNRFSLLCWDGESMCSAPLSLPKRQGTLASSVESGQSQVIQIFHYLNPKTHWETCTTKKHILSTELSIIFVFDGERKRSKKRILMDHIQYIRFICNLLFCFSLFKETSIIYL